MFRISAKAFVDNRIKDDALFIQRQVRQVPREVLVRYNVIARGAALEPIPSGGTPFRTGALRRSIVTNVRGNTAIVGWRVPYAGITNEGKHDSGAPIKKWTTPGTGAHFMERTKAVADARIKREIPAILRSLGLTR